MSEENNLIVKAFYTNAEGHQEIRRFGIPESASTNYDYLLQRVQNVFRLGSQDLNISWQDSDGDNITISSDEELFEAIRESLLGDPNLLRIFVVAGGKQNKDSSKSGDLHEGVVCDGCDGSIYGARFKCLSCPDYDLCSKCKDKGTHSHHNMSSIFKTSTGSKTEVRCENLGNEDATFHFNIKTDVNGGDATARSSAWSTSCPLPHKGRWGRGRGHGRRNHCNNAWAGWGPQCHAPPPPPPPPYFFTPNESKCNPDGTKPNCSKKSERQESNGEFPWASFGFGIPPPMPGLSAEADQAARTAAEEATKFVGQIMKDIWTSWSGANSAETATPATDDPIPTNMEDKSAAKNSETSAESSKKDTDENEVIIEEPKASTTVSPSPPRSDTQSPEVMEISHSVQTEPVEESSQMEADEWTLINKDGPQTISPRGSLSDSSASNRTVYPSLDHSSSGHSSLQNGAASIDAAVNAPPPKPQASSRPKHRNPRVQTAIEQMHAMGYSDEGGWLTRLLEMKDGNINGVLDLLMPAKK